VGPSIWSVPYQQNSCFIGRELVLTEIRQRFTQGRKAALVQAISGLGGIGKTQTAVEYAYRFRDKYQAVLWINAESALELKAGFGELTQLLRLPHAKNDLNQAALALKRWLATQTDWLVVFDNADQPVVLKAFLPDTENGNVLVTSRAQDFQHIGIINPIDLKQLNVEEASEFLLRRCDRPQADAAEREAAAQLARDLDGLPLALEQAAAYIVERRTTFQRYLESYRKRGLKLIEAHAPAFGPYNRSVATTWEANFDAVQEESPAAASVLQLSAFLDPNAVPFELLTRGAPELGPDVRDALGGADIDPLLVNDLLQPLGRFSLIRTDGHNECYTIHRMVQEVLQTAMDNATRRLWVERAIRAVNKALPAVEYTYMSLCKKLMPHALALISYRERELVKLPDAGQLLYNMSRHLHQRGQYAEAVPISRQAIEICREYLGEKHPDYAASLRQLAVVYMAMGRYADAEPIFLQANEIWRSALGEGHSDYATSLSDLALLYRTTGRYAEAEAFFRQSAEIYRTTLGERDPGYAGSLNSLGVLYRATGRYAEAEPLFRQAHEIFRTSLGEQHPKYAASLHNMAELYVTMGRYVEAEPLCLAATKICSSALGEQHPDYATSLGTLASLYQATNRDAEAVPLLQSVLEISRTTLGEQHPDYACALNNLASLYLMTGRYAEAEAHFRQAAEICRAVLGDQHPRYAASLNNLAGVYQMTGRHAEAVPLFRQTLKILRFAFGPSNPEYVTALNNYKMSSQILGWPIEERNHDAHEDIR
jgi:tetratricopeptide (TPR) repeat protein